MRRLNIPKKLRIKETDFRVVFGGTKIDFDPDKEEYNRKKHKYSLQSAVDLLERWILPITSTPFITSYDAGQNQATHAKLNHTTNIPKSRSF